MIGAVGHSSGGTMRSICLRILLFIIVGSTIAACGSLEFAVNDNGKCVQAPCDAPPPAATDATPDAGSANPTATSASWLHYITSNDLLLARVVQRTTNEKALRYVAVMQYDLHQAHTYVWRQYYAFPEAVTTPHAATTLTPQSVFNARSEITFNDDGDGVRVEYDHCKGSALQPTSVMTQEFAAPTHPRHMSLMSYADSLTPMTTDVNYEYDTQWRVVRATTRLGAPGTGTTSGADAVTTYEYNTANLESRNHTITNTKDGQVIDTVDSEYDAQKRIARRTKVSQIILTGFPTPKTTKTVDVYQYDGESKRGTYQRTITYPDGKTTTHTWPIITTEFSGSLQSTQFSGATPLQQCDFAGGYNLAHGTITCTTMNSAIGVEESITQDDYARPRAEYLSSSENTQNLCGVAVEKFL